MVVRGLSVAAAAPELLQAEGTQVLLRVRVPTSAHLLRYLRGDKGEIILLQVSPDHCISLAAQQPQRRVCVSFVSNGMCMCQVKPSI